MKMCRLLYIKSNEFFDINYYLEKFAVICKNSKEYQGHGFGLAYLDEKNNYQYYKNIKPIWENDFSYTKNKKTKILIAHARSAFEDKDIIIENNMPFYDENYVFIFNGELRGVRIKEQGRIGAEKIFNFIKRFDKKENQDSKKESMKKAMEKAISLIKKRTDYIKALNIIIADKENAFVNNYFTTDEEYFCLRMKKEKKINQDKPNEFNEKLIICSQEFEDDNKEEWKKLDLGIYVF
ncbi:MAG: class II glutamine amidotransferase [Candidatus Woesearchaeota archaeon]